MASKNRTDIFEIALWGILNQADHQSFFFLFFLSIYLLGLLGNLLIILLIRVDDHLLHTPMYFFLSHLALADTFFISTTVPKILTNWIFEIKTISYSACLTQMYFFLIFGNTDNFLLACMAYDRYMAICRPLNYTMVMNQKFCLLLASGSWVISALHSLLYTLLISGLSFCNSGEIFYFFCDVYPLLELSCSDTRLIKILAQTEGMLDILGPLFLIIISNARIFWVILKIPMTTGKCKAFSTCGSHLATVVLFYGTISCLYFQPTSAYSAKKGTFLSLLYAMVIPVLNPFIYSLRNHDIKAALWRLFRRLRDFSRK